MSDATETEFLQDWFAKYGLPWSDNISQKLFDLGVECVEGLNFFPAEVFMDLFCCEKFIVKEKAKLARRRSLVFTSRYKRSLAFICLT